MDMLLYLIGAIAIIFLFFSLLPLLLPLIIILVIAFFILMWYLKRKVRKQMQQYENTYAESNTRENENSTYTTYASKHQTSDDIIDVEFTETDQ